ncbi:MAG: DUF2851 family protein [Candidatus Cloacimonetes bacterium]|nr:DUF2851 family protein [Candidatus Cloacimonadota bacterium]
MNQALSFPERFLYHIWDGQKYQPRMTTESGKLLRVLFPGEWNTDSGPDFRHAIVQIGDVIYKGDVEIHIKAKDWFAHHHQKDSAYNKIILHVVFQNIQSSPYITTENGIKVETVALSRFIEKPLITLQKQFSTSKPPDSKTFCVRFARTSFYQVESFLEEMGFRRLERKVSRFAAEKSFCDYNELLYKGIMEALGYSKNKTPMLNLSEYVRLPQLQKLIADGTDLDSIIALLLGSSGLINKLPMSLTQKQQQLWQKRYSLSRSHPTTLLLEWNLFRQRPGNHPAIRLLQAAAFFYENSTPLHHILRGFSLLKESNDFQQPLRNLDTLFEASGKLLPESCGIGKSRVRIITVNVIIPLILLYAREHHYKDFEQYLLRFYQHFAPLPPNRTTRYMEKFLDNHQCKVQRKRAILQQGLTELYHTRCSKHLCYKCESETADEIVVREQQSPYYAVANNTMVN